MDEDPKPGVTGALVPFRVEEGERRWTGRGYWGASTMWVSECLSDIVGLRVCRG